MSFDTERFIAALIKQSPPHLLEHIQLVLIPLFIAFLIAFPTGILLTRPGFRRYSEKVMAVFNAGQTIPPLAVIALFFPFLGLGYRPALVALTIYALLPIARNTLSGIAGIAPEIKEAAKGMGMSSREILMKVEIPLSIPIIMTGVKTSAVLTAGTAALAAMVGGKGMGAVIFAGINFFRPELILAGTILIGLLAILLDRILTLVESIISPSLKRI